jgi:hypothetical protein
MRLLSLKDGAMRWLVFGVLAFAQLANGRAASCAKNLPAIDRAGAPA